MTFRVGITAGFGHSLNGEFAGIASYGFSMIRQDVFAQHDPAVAELLVRECVGQPTRMLFLIGGGKMQSPDGSPILPNDLVAQTVAVVQTAALAGLGDYAIEIGNEPNLADPMYGRHPADFAKAVRQCYDAARANRFDGEFVLGGVSNLNPECFAYLAGVMASGVLAADMTIGFHRYPESGRGPLAPHVTTVSREDEWNIFRSIVTENWAVACTEFGYHTAYSEPITLTDETQADAVMYDLAFYDQRQVRWAVVYQLADGPTDTWADRYGVRTYDRVWKVVAQRIRDTYGVT